MKTYTQDQTIVIAPQGYLSGGDETDALERSLKDVFDQGTNHIIVDCTEVIHMGSAALGVLISWHSRTVRSGGRLVLANVGKKLENNLTITKLILVFDVYPTVELAVAALTKSASQPTHPERSPK